ncbi:MAG: glycosyltransferase family 4 protein [Betaproteobacteria bacterium]|nr:glycosyltransferase family 4 protein [Betaproteobacteria bacterium]
MSAGSLSHHDVMPVIERARSRAQEAGHFPGRKGARRALHIVHTEASLGWGGQEIRILNEASGMIRRGHAVTVLCPAHAKIYAEAHRRGIPVVALPIGRKSLRGIAVLYRWLSQHTPDVINTHSSTDSWLVALAARALRRGPPMVRTRHISTPVPRNRFTRWLYQNATAHIVTTGAQTRNQLICDNGYVPERITPVPTGVDGEYFRPGDRGEARRLLGLPPEATLVGIVATLRSWKGHRYLVEAFAGLSDPAARLVIVGGGPQERALREQVAAMGLAERVIMPGNQAEVLPWLRALDVFVLPSYGHEGVPQALLQAMLCQLPVVTTPVGGILEAVAHDESALVVEPRNAEALRGALEQLLGDAGLRDRLGQCARGRAREFFSFDAMLDKMETIFLACAAPARSR